MLITRPAIRPFDERATTTATPTTTTEARYGQKLAVYNQPETSLWRHHHHYSFFAPRRAYFCKRAASNKCSFQAATMSKKIKTPPGSGAGWCNPCGPIEPLPAPFFGCSSNLNGPQDGPRLVLPIGIASLASRPPLGNGGRE